MTTPPRPLTRAGHIQYTGNRFCGADVFGQLAHTVVTPTDLMMRAFGARALDDSDRELLRCVALALTSPDPRVWPLKLTRLLASHGNEVAAFHGAQLANAGRVMGPGTGRGCAEALAFIDRFVGDALDDDDRIAAALAAYMRAHGRIGGFGVPFRAEDERVVGLHALLADHPITQRRIWRLHLRVADVMRRRHDVPRNVVLPLATIALDLGIAPRRMSMFICVMLMHTYAAHALEASDDGGEVMRVLPPETLDYRGTPPRISPAAARAADQAAMR